MTAHGADEDHYWLVASRILDRGLWADRGDVDAGTAL